MAMLLLKSVLFYNSRLDLRATYFEQMENGGSLSIVRGRHYMGVEERSARALPFSLVCSLSGCVALCPDMLTLPGLVIMNDLVVGG